MRAEIERVSAECGLYLAREYKSRADTYQAVIRTLRMPGPEVAAEYQPSYERDSRGLRSNRALPSV